MLSASELINTEERLDTQLLTTKLENENYENEKINYVVKNY